MKVVGENRLESSVLMLSIHKSGSTLLDKMAKSICEKKNISYFSPPNFFFSKGVKRDEWESDPDNIAFMSNNFGVVWSGFRVYGELAETYALSQVAAGKSLRVIVLIRDPRDAFVSRYYSTIFSHKLPGEGDARDQFLKNRENALQMDLDTFCERQIAAYRNRTGLAYNLECLLDGADKLKDSGVPVSIYRYEDIIFSKYYWVNSLCRDMGLPDNLTLDKEELHAIALQHDILPTIENVNAHVRNVSPGDHARKLQLETISNLNEALMPLLLRCGYSY